MAVLIKSFQNNFPGKDWAKSFFKCQKHIISPRWFQNAKRSKTAINYEIISEYFYELNESLQVVEPRSIINDDETNLTDDPGVQKNVRHQGCKRPT